MLLDMQAGQACAMGYFGGYVGKEQQIGAKETERLSEAFSKKIEGARDKKKSCAEKLHRMH